MPLGSTFTHSGLNVQVLPVVKFSLASLNKFIHVQAVLELLLELSEELLELKLLLEELLEDELLD